MVIYTDRFTDFPEYSQYQMPDNQTASHFQSIFNKKNQLWFNPSLNNLFQKLINFQNNK